jgi:hypothetical protein|uniref:DNA helix destabilizing protein n=1 Tax=Myoviridae sp. ctiu99 TaxID=2825158 RepID=A0A8S5NW90_9CAUD|nr:MAG TPA: DNA helix destabilizing protein [Myoviridae sp. ctiu99]
MNSVRITTGKVRLSYANIWAPKSFDGQPEKYSCSLIIPKSDTKTVGRIREAIKTLLADKDVQTKLGGKTKGLKMPLRDGDTDREDDPNYADCYFINASATPEHRPLILDRDKNEVLDQSEVYSGCYCQASISLYAFNSNGNKGIGCGLRGIRKLADGEPLGGSVVTADEFDDDDIDDTDDIF